MSGGYTLITGASSGLGAEFAKQLAAKGRNLVLVARRRDKLQALAETLRKQHGITVVVIDADLMLPGAAEQIEAACRDQQLTIDGLINNAGIAGPDLLNDRDWTQQRDFFQLMMTSVA